MLLAVFHNLVVHFRAQSLKKMYLTVLIAEMTSL